MIRSPLVSVVLPLIACPTAAGHDYWIQPDTFAPSLNKSVAVRVFVGDHFKSEGERPFQKQPTVRFQLLSASQAVDLAARGREGKTPMAEITCPQPGYYWVALERGPHLIKLDADKFNRYLAEEGLRTVLEQRRQAKEDRLPGRERYRRYLKGLLRAGGKGDETWKKVLGHKLEIVPLDDPGAIRPGGTLKARVLFEGKPLANAALFALGKSADKVSEQKLTTAADGTASVAVKGRGTWLVRLVHMRRCVGRTDADWESLWSALTFAVE
jgi:uncharacterized GH25 family protein